MFQDEHGNWSGDGGSTCEGLESTSQSVISVSVSSHISLQIPRRRM